IRQELFRTRPCIIFWTNNAKPIPGSFCRIRLKPEASIFSRSSRLPTFLPDRQGGEGRSKKLFVVLAVLLVFGAKVFEQIFVSNQGLPLGVRDSLAVGLRIVDRHVNLEM